MVLKLSTYSLKLLKTIKTTLFQQEFVIPAYFMQGNDSKPILTFSWFQAWKTILEQLGIFETCLLFETTDRNSLILKRLRWDFYGLLCRSHNIGMIFLLILPQAFWANLNNLSVSIGLKSVSMLQIRKRIDWYVMNYPYFIIFSIIKWQASKNNAPKT